MHATLALTAATMLDTAERCVEIDTDLDSWISAGVLTGEDEPDYEPRDPDEAALGQPIVDVHLPDPDDLEIDQRPAEAEGPAPSEADYTHPDDTDRQVWHAGDPEPLDVPALVDREGDTWINLEPNSWYEQHTGRYSACSWSSVLEYAPLRRPQQPTAATLLADSREG